MKVFCTIALALALLRLHAQSPAVLIYDGARLKVIKEKLLQKDAGTVQLLSKLRATADTLLTMKRISVMDKKFTPQSGNKHDYMSQAPYFWYDSSKPNGKPYLRRDGERNPEIYNITDRTYLGKLDKASRTLALAWYFTGDERYAAKATDLLQTWFLADSTRMHPNLDYGQAVPGVNSGRGIGIIETISLTGIADAATLLQGSRSWTATYDKSLKQWYAAYLQWMLTSKNGKEEHAAKNNHCTWYFAQAIDFALFTGNKSTAQTLIEESRQRLDSQLTGEGKQPLELERTNGLGYSTMNLQGWFTVATLAGDNGYDLWHYKTSRGSGLQKAFDWLLPYATGQKSWTYQQISKYSSTSAFYPLLLQAATGFKNPAYLQQASALSPGEENLLSTLLYSN